MSEYTQFAILNSMTELVQQDIKNLSQPPSENAPELTQQGADNMLDHINTLTGCLQRSITENKTSTNEMARNMLSNINNLTNLIIQKEKTENVNKSITYLLQNINSLNKSPISENVFVLNKSPISENAFILKKEIQPQTLVLLSFEDDTMRIAIKLDDNYANIINNWYDKMNAIVEIENLNITVPHDIHKSDLNEILYNNFNVTSKNPIINDFVPQFMLKLKLEKHLKNSNFFIQPINNNYWLPPKLEQKNNNENFITFEKLGIIIPNNIGNNTNKNNVFDDTQYQSANFVAQPSNDDFPFNKSSQYEKIKGSIILDYISTKSDIEFDGNGVSPYHDMTYDKYASVEQLDVIKVDNILIVLNYMQLTTFILVNPSDEETKIIKEHTEYGFIKLLEIETTNTHIETFIKETFENYVFNNIDELNKTLDILSRYVELFSKSTKLNEIHNTEEKQIHAFLKSDYIINDDINNKIKFTDLYNIILMTTTLSIDKKNGLKNRLSTYLKNLGLIKKRYSDGYYYYGIRRKNMEECQLVMGEYLMEIKTREEEEKKNFNLKNNYEKLIIERNFLNNNKSDVFQTPITKTKDLSTSETVCEKEITI